MLQALEQIEITCRRWKDLVTLIHTNKIGIDGKMGTAMFAVYAFAWTF